MSSTLLTIAEAGAALGLSDSTIRRLIRIGQLRAVRAGRAVRIPADALTAFEAVQPDRVPAPVVPTSDDGPAGDGAGRELPRAVGGGARERR